MAGTTPKFEGRRQRDCRGAATRHHSPRLGDESCFHGLVRQRARRPTTSGRPGAVRPDIQAALERLQVRLVPGLGPSGTTLRISPIPGDDVVDYIGLDVYDFKYEGSAAERWDSYYLKAPFGLEWHREFAARHGKAMSYPEWGVGNFGDNPFFIQQIARLVCEEPRAISPMPPISTFDGCGRPRSTTISFQSLGSSSGNCSGAHRELAGASKG